MIVKIGHAAISVLYNQLTLLTFRCDLAIYELTKSDQ